NGVSYNSYVISDDKTVLLDTVDHSVSKNFIENLKYTLDGKKLDYIVINHMEPDHCATLDTVLSMYPDAQIYGSMQVSKMITQFYGIDVSDRFTAVKENDTLNTGKHTLKFVMAPMVHWPEVMVTYDEYDKYLYSADAFGIFGAMCGNIFAEDTGIWNCNLSEARRYYTNIVGKYGMNVQTLLKKASALDIKAICPLHGPIIRENLDYYFDLYNKWSTYTPEDDSIVIAYASIYGGTENAAAILATKLAEKGAKNIRMYDVSKTHVSYLIAEGFRASKLVFAAPTLDTGLFPAMEMLLLELKHKNLSNRTVAFIENGTWAPMAAKHMSAIVSEMKNMTIIPETVSIKSALSETDIEKLDALAAALV
nr:FprA family A-type flavoprotein [Butyrivibrio sp.]